MRSHILPIVLLAAAALGLTQIASTADSAEQPSDATRIREARLDQNRAIRAGDIPRAAQYWMKDIHVQAGLGGRVSGIDTLQAAFAADGRIFYERIPTDIQVSANWPLAWEAGRWTGRDRSAQDSVIITGWYSAQWAKTDAGWRIRSELFVANECSGAACSWSAR